MRTTGKNQLVFAAFLLAMLFSISVQFCFQQVPLIVKAQTTPSPSNTLTSESSGNFSVIWITDTQYLSETYPTYFDALCRWIVNNAEKYDIKMVIHTGDIVDTEGNQTQWANANRSMSILLDAGIPYSWNAGNHDFNETCWIGNRYAAFNSTFLAEKSYWVDDEFDGQNTAIQVNVSGWKLLVVNLENLANNTALNWANSVLDSHPDSNAIVATHAYLNDQGKYTYQKSGQDDSWAREFNATVLETHSNVFLTLNGHFNTNTGRRTQVGGRNELMFDRQDEDGSLGGATLRILTFDRADSVIDVKTFVLYANSFLRDSSDQFTLGTSFHNDSAQVPEFSVEVILLLFVALLVIAAICCKHVVGMQVHSLS